MTAQPILDAVLDDADARAARRAQQQHRRAGREAALGLPPRPNLSRGGSRRLVPDMAWTTDAECVGAPDRDLWSFTEATSQLDAADVIERYCSGCPVARECLTAGRELLAWGVWGGHVLLDGWLAPERPAVPRSSRQLASAKGRPLAS